VTAGAPTQAVTLLALRAIQKNGDAVTLELTRDELMAAANALNEVLNGPEAIEEWEFHPRMGPRPRRGGAGA